MRAFKGSMSGCQICPFVQAWQPLNGVIATKNRNPLRLRFFLRAGERTRTADLLITNEVRYRLCHASINLVLCSLFSGNMNTILYKSSLVNTNFRKNIQKKNNELPGKAEERKRSA